MVEGRRGGHALGLLFLDLDGFKPLNDRFGHAFGDEVLKDVGALLQKSVRGSDVVARVIRSLFDTARQYRESFDVYGSKKSFEWQLVEGEEPVLHTAKKPEPEIPERVPVPDFAHLLPEPIQRLPPWWAPSCSSSRLRNSGGDSSLACSNSSDSAWARAGKSRRRWGARSSAA